MRELLIKNASGAKLSLNEVLNAINTFETRAVTDDDADHFFKVELIDVINAYQEIFCNTKGIKDYLSFVAPVPYEAHTMYNEKIKQHAAALNYKLDEYMITLNGEQISKKYKTHFKIQGGEDDIYDIKFHDFRDDTNNLIAWMWFGMSKFKGTISSDSLMRNLRLRKENIQIGNADTLQSLFRESRGLHYFIGEVFAVSKDLIPNSQRDYFNENETCAKFNQMLKQYFRDDLEKIYRKGSEINSANRRIDTYNKAVADFDAKMQSGSFDNADHIKAEETRLERLQVEAENAKKKLDKIQQTYDESSDSPISQLFHRVLNSREIMSSITADERDLQREISDKRSSYRTSKLSGYTRREQKMISKIFSIIRGATKDKLINDKIAEALIAKIEDGLK